MSGKCVILYMEKVSNCMEICLYMLYIWNLSVICFVFFGSSSRPLGFFLPEECPTITTEKPNKIYMQTNIFRDTLVYILLVGVKLLVIEYNIHKRIHILIY